MNYSWAPAYTLSPDQVYRLPTILQSGIIIYYSVNTTRLHTQQINTQTAKLLCLSDLSSQFYLATLQYSTIV